MMTAAAKKSGWRPLWGPDRVPVSCPGSHRSFSQATVFVGELPEDKDKKLPTNAVPGKPSADEKGIWIAELKFPPDQESPAPFGVQFEDDLGKKSELTASIAIVDRPKDPGPGTGQP